jgi:4-carboxymuconolactone decarboxylase
MPVARLAGAAAEAIVGIERPAPPATPEDPGEQRARGEETMQAVYGFSVPEERYEASLLARTTVHHLFAEIWARPALSIRDRRLLTMGAVAALGNGELWELQLKAAHANGEVTLEQMQEMVLHMAHYIGWPRTIAIEQAVQRLLAELAPDGAAGEPGADG